MGHAPASASARLCRRYAEDNLLFNLVQETHDHGPVNGWTERPTSRRLAPPRHTLDLQQRDIWRRNFVIRGYPQTLAGSSRRATDAGQ